MVTTNQKIQIKIIINSIFHLLNWKNIFKYLKLVTVLFKWQLYATKMGLNCQVLLESNPARNITYIYNLIYI